MPTIDIRRDHAKPVKDAKKAVERLAEKISERFDLHYEWVGDTLHFERSGVSGNIALTKDEVAVTAHLSFLLSALRGPIEREIHKQIDEQFC